MRPSVLMTPMARRKGLASAVARSSACISAADKPRRRSNHCWRIEPLRAGATVVDTPPVVPTRADPLVAAQHFKDLAVSGVYWPRVWGVRGELTEAELEQQVACAVETFLRAYAP